MFIHNEDPANTRDSSTKVTAGWAYKQNVQADVNEKSAEAEEINPEFFNSDLHNDTVDRSIEICNAVMGRRGPAWTQSRGRGRQSNKPFTAVKYEEAGISLRKYTRQWKEDNFYGPLRALGIDAKVDTKNGSLLYRVYAGPKITAKK